jgi:hypothetical protein
MKKTSLISLERSLFTIRRQAVKRDEPRDIENGSLASPEAIQDRFPSLGDRTGRGKRLDATKRQRPFAPQQLRSARTSREPFVFAEDTAQPQLFFEFNRDDPDGLLVVYVSSSGVAEQVGEAARQSGSEVNSGRPENDRHTRCHVFARMLAYAFDYSQRTAVAYGKSFSGSARNVQFSARCTVQYGVTG